jgi:Ca2+-binding RTX toxin-like protein
MSYDPLAITPLADAYVPFENAQPTRYIWVSPTGSNSNSGSQGSPLKTIQAAVDRATPGTAIMVKAGTYRENVQLKVDGTTDKPIWLTSADGIGSAKIVAATNSKSVIYAHGEDNWIVKGFETQGGSNGIQFTMSGADIRNMGTQGMTKNVVIQDNIIRNVAVDDGIKLSQAQNFVVVGNRIEGGVGEEGIDNVYTVNSVFAYNTIKNTNGLSGITVKGASKDIHIHHNVIDGAKTDGILIGGWSTNTGALFPKTGYEARNVIVEHNEIHDVGKRSINVLAGWDSVVRNNLFDPQNTYNTVVHVDKDNSGWISQNIRFEGNITSRSSWLTVQSGSKNVTQSGNVANGTWSTKAGTSAQPTDGAAPAPTPAPQDPGPVESPAPSPTKWAASAAWTSSKYGSTTQGKADSLTGTSGHDYLDGRSGTDTMTGGRGDDTYVVGHPGDKVVEKAGEGTDTVHLWGGTYTLAANVENLEIRQTTGTPVVTDNGLDNILIAQAKTADTFRFVKSNGQDLVKGFTVGQDKIAIDGSIDLGKVGVSHAGGDMVINLGSGNTITIRGVASTTTLADVTGKSVSSPAPAPAPAEYVPPQGSWKESAAWTSSKYGSTTQGKADSLTGTSGHDYLDGRSGIDTMTGGRGDDTYLVGHPSDKAVEKAGEGIDTVHLWGGTYTLAANVENLVIRQVTGTPVVTDNGLDNILIAQAKTADTFRFVKENGHDLVKGFTVGQDRIDLDPSILASQVEVHHHQGNMILELQGDNSITLAGVGPTVQLQDVLA